MYKGYNLVLQPLNEESIANFYSTGISLYEEDKTNSRKTLKDFIFSDNSLDGSKIQATWFPQIEADVFISHSHNDEVMAITLAGWLWDSFKIKAFVDSCIWGYSNELLKLIDDEYCMQSDGYYNYETRNFSTSHVHMMLSSALSMMINKTECIIFLNTPSSVKPYEGIQKTESPWIYNEIVTTQLVQENVPKRLLNLNESQWLNASGKIKSKDGERFFAIEHNLDLGHLKLITLESLKNWQDKQKEGHPLDTLYKLYP